MANEKISFDNLEEYDGYLRNDANILKRNTNYVEGNIVNKGQVFLKCTQSGRTKSTTLSLSGVSVGNILEDGAVKWEVVSINGIPQGGSIVDWKPNHSYKENDIFVSEHQIYKVLVEFTSGSTFENIEILEDYEPEEWQPNTSYVIGDVFIESGVLYKVVNAFTSGATFSVTSDIELYGEKEYQEGQEIITNDIVEYNGNYYKALIDFTCGKEFTKTAFEEYVPKSLTDEEIEEVIRSYTPEFSGNSGGSGLSIWQANTAYNINDVVIDSNLIWQCVVAHTSTTTFDESKWVCLSGGEISNGLEIVPLWEGDFSFSNSTEGATPTSSTPMIELSESISNFEYIRIFTRVEQADREQVSNLGYVPYLINNGSMRCGVVATNSVFATCEAKFYDSTHVFIYHANIYNWASGQISRIEGIRKAKPIVSSGMKYETLWEGEAGDYSSSFNITIPTSEPITKYKKLGLNICLSNGNTNYYRELDVNVIMGIINASSGVYTMNNGYSNTDDYVDILSSSSISQLVINGNKSKITKIIGISEGVQIPTGVQAARVTLWEGFYNTPNNSVVITQTQEISSIEGFDQFEVTFDGFVSNTHHEKVTQVYNVSDIVYGIQNFRISVVATNGSGTGAGAGFGFVDNTHFGIGYLDKHDWTEPCGFTKIVGIKYIQPDSYSTEEKLIGTWIDGKPLYQITMDGYVLTNSNSYTNVYDLSSLNIDKVVTYDVCTYSGNTTYCGNAREANYNLLYFINNQFVFTVVQSGWNNYIVRATFKYTKTTA